MLNYLARLGWSHGDDEIFSREQMVAWFDGGHLSKSPAQWDAAKLDWVNAHYLQARSTRRACSRSRRRSWRGAASSRRRATPCCAPARSFKDRCSTGAELADWLAIVFADVAPSADDLALHVTDAVRPALATLRDKLAAVRGTRRRSPPRSRKRWRRTASRCRSSRRRCACSSAAAPRRRRSTPCSRCSIGRRCWPVWRGLAGTRRRDGQRWL